MCEGFGIHVDGKFRKDPAPTIRGDTCPCGGRLELEYGFGDGYGFGCFDRCDTCFTVYNFHEDLG